MEVLKRKKLKVDISMRIENHSFRISSIMRIYQNKKNKFIRSISNTIPKNINNNNSKISLSTNNKMKENFPKPKELRAKITRTSTISIG